MFLYLKGVHLKELKCIVNFMYNGNVSIEEDSLSKLLAVASELEVKGFTELEKNEETTSVNSSRTSRHRLEPEVEREPSENIVATSKRKVDFDHDIGVDEMLDAYLKKAKADHGKELNIGCEEVSRDEIHRTLNQRKGKPSDSGFTNNETSMNSDVGTPLSSGGDLKRAKVDRSRTGKIKQDEEVDDRVEAAKQSDAEPNDSGFTAKHTSRDSGSGETLERVKFLKSKRGNPVLVDSEGYTYLMNTQKSDKLYWVCQQTKVENCRGSVITKGFHIAWRKIQHSHSPRLPPIKDEI